MNLLQMVDKYLESPLRDREFTPPRGHHPSSASCAIKTSDGSTRIAGKCLRAIYWSSTDVPKSNPMTARGIRICNVGKAVERLEVEKYKEMGIWRANNVKFYNEVYGVSGEADAIVWDAEKKQDVGVEIKTGYDYQFRKVVLGTKYKKGTPKNEHLLQTMLYVDYFKMPFKIIYIDRGNAQRGEYDITLNPDGVPNVDGKKVTNGISISGCVERFKLIENYISSKTLPPRDFAAKYEQSKIEDLYKAGELNKEQTKEFEKNKDVDMGDWECNYCDYKDLCASIKEAK